MKTHPTTPTPVPNPLVPVLLVAAEIGCSIDDLASRYRSEVIVDAAGVRCLRADAGRRIIEDHHADVRAARERERRDRLEATRRGNPTVDRVRALQRAQRAREGTSATASAAEVLLGDRR